MVSRVTIFVAAFALNGTASASIQSQVMGSAADRHFTLSRGGSTSIVKRSESAVEGGKPSVKRTEPAAKGKIVPASKGQSASVPNEIFNLVKNIVGAGVLGLPAGIAAFGSSSNALIPTSILIFSIGFLSAYGFSLIGRVCSYTGALSYREAWEKSVSPKSGWVPAAACFLVTSCAVLSYSMILSDTIPQLAIAFTGKVITRTQALLSVTSFVLLPLCLMKNLKSLGLFSLMGIIGMFYTTFAMATRWLDGSYSAGGRYFENLAPQFVPSFASKSIANSVFDPNIFLLISMLSTAFMAHYNAPKFYWELENNTLARYNLVVVTSFVISCLLFAAISSIGFATFGQACAGLVLNNYSTDDPLMSLSRLAVSMSLLFSYPLAFVGVRDGILDLFDVKERGDKLVNTVSVGLLAIITGLAFVVKDLGKVFAFGGATWGNAVVYLFPTYMFTKVAYNHKPELKKEVPRVIATGIIGLAMGIIGTTRAIKK